MTERILKIVPNTPPALTPGLPANTTLIVIKEKSDGTTTASYSAPGADEQIETADVYENSTDAVSDCLEDLLSREIETQVSEWLARANTPTDAVKYIAWALTNSLEGTGPWAEPLEALVKALEDSRQ